MGNPDFELMAGGVGSDNEEKSHSRSSTSLTSEEDSIPTSPPSDEDLVCACVCLCVRVLHSMFACVRVCVHSHECIYIMYCVFVCAYGRVYMPVYSVCLCVRMVHARTHTYTQICWYSYCL